MSQPRVIFDAAIAAGPMNFATPDGPRGVNLFCCEQLVTAALWDDARATVTVSSSHGGARWARPTAASRRELQRVKFECSACGRSTIARAEKFIAIVEKLVRHGWTKLTLAGLDDILSRS
jgi:hypothetical protein